MIYPQNAMLIASLLFMGMLLLLEVGRRVAQRRIARDAKGDMAGIGLVDGSVFTLLGLLLAFTFSGAATRLDARRQLIVEETNDIGTAYLRLDLLPASAQPALREKFRQYVDSRLAAYRKLPDVAAAREELARSASLQGEIWNQAVAATRAPDTHPDAARLLIPALNSMIDITTTRTMTMQMHPPAIVFVMLVVLALVSSLLAGYGMARGKSRNWIHIICFAIAMSVSVFVILDLEFPRAGWIREDAFDQSLIDLRQTMN